MVKITTMSTIRSHTELVKADSGRLKTTEPTACGRAEDTGDASLVPSPSVGQSRREQLPVFPEKVKRRRAPVMVPILSWEGKPLMPCHPARARELIKKKGAKVRWYKGIYSVQLIHKNDGRIQPVICGVDPGFYREAFTVQSNSHTYLNILSDAATWVSYRVSMRRDSRKSRRGRKTPCRKSRSNRKNNRAWLAPSVRSRWSLKLQIINFVRKLYPISCYVVEDIKAENRKNCKKWNRLFVPLEMGKVWFYEELAKIGSFILKFGYDTYERREFFNLKKSKDKLSDSFYSHTVDSWVLASFLTGRTVIDNTDVFRMVPIKFHRRVLHSKSPSRGGRRKFFGGTISLKFKRGSVVIHKTLGLVFVGGTNKGRITLRNTVTGNNLTSRALPEDCTFLYYNRWRTGFIDECGCPIGKRHRDVYLNLSEIYSDPKIVERKRKTTLDRYGVENFTNRDKAKKTTMERYGYEYTCSVPAVIQKRVATLKERYGKVFNVDEPHNKKHMPDNFIQEFNSGKTIEELAKMFCTSGVTVKRWIDENGFKRDYIIQSVRCYQDSATVVGQYFRACLLHNKTLSFYEYGKLHEARNRCKMKRLFNAGRKFSHLKDELFAVALDPDRHGGFLDKII